MKTAENLVSIAECSGYVPSSLRPALDALLEPLGGMQSFVSTGDRVLLKLNLLNAAAPERAVTTQPELVVVVAEMVRECGGEVEVGDSPGGRNAPAAVEKVLEESRIGEVCREEQIPIKIFDEDSVSTQNPRGKLYKNMTVGKALLDADVVIGLSRLKTHGFMMLTGAVKLMFGAIPGIEKAWYHLKVPDRRDFADMLIDLLQLVPPDLSIMDAVVAMEGNGPSAGAPRRLETLLAGRSAPAVDAVASKLIGIDPASVYTNRAAQERELLPTDVRHVPLAGEDLEHLIVGDFGMPSRDIADRVPKILYRFVKDFTTAKPVVESAQECTQCAVCVENCPVGAIELLAEIPDFDYGRCIRCYCCSELCPNRVVGVRSPRISRILGRGRS